MKRARYCAYLTLAFGLGSDLRNEVLQRTRPPIVLWCGVEAPADLERCDVPGCECPDHLHVHAGGKRGTFDREDS